MTFCHECGKPVIPPTAKFCRNCGAAQLEDAPQATMPAPATPQVPVTIPVPDISLQQPQAVQTRPVSPQIPAEPASLAPCKSCGGPVGSGEKFCGFCGVPADQQPLIPIPARETPVPSSVSVCASCGSPLAEKGKFCGVCGTRVNTSATPAPLPSPPPSPSSQQPEQSSEARLCRSCGNVIKPGDKFCSKCLAKVVDNITIAPNSHAFVVPSASPEVPSPPPLSPPPQQPAQSSRARLCRSCGNPINPGDKFCSKCLVLVADSPPSTEVQNQAPVPPVQPATPPASLPVCTSCQSPITGTEKFCGICGTPVIFPPSISSEVLHHERNTCRACGAEVSPTTKFCGACGAAVGAAPLPIPHPSVQSAATVSHPSSQGTLGPSGEEIIGVIANARKMKMFGTDTYNIVITNRRMIIAQMTKAMLNAAILEAQAKAKAEGRGFLSMVKDQMAAQFQFALRYLTMSPDLTLAETAGNRAIENARITAIFLKLKESGSGEIDYTEFMMTIESFEGKSEFMIGEDDRFINLLRTVYGDRLHMPAGYFKAGGARITFF